MLLLQLLLLLLLKQLLLPLLQSQCLPDRTLPLQSSLLVPVLQRERQTLLQLRLYRSPVPSEELPLRPLLLQLALPSAGSKPALALRTPAVGTGPACEAEQATFPAIWPGQAPEAEAAWHQTGTGSR